MNRGGRGWSKVVRILVFAFSPASALAGPVVFYDEGFETGFPVGATASGSWSTVNSLAAAHTGSAGADIDGSTATSGDTLTLPISSVGYQTIVASFWGKVRAGLEGDDQILIEWTENGTDWVLLQTISNQVAGDWVAYSFNLPATADNDPDLTLRFLANLSSTGDRMGFDDLDVTGIPIPEPTPLSLLSLGGGLVTLVRRRFA